MPLRAPGRPRSASPCRLPLPRPAASHGEKRGRSRHRARHADTSRNEASPPREPIGSGGDVFLARLGSGRRRAPGLGSDCLVGLPALLSETDYDVLLLPSCVPMGPRMSSLFIASRRSGFLVYRWRALDNQTAASKVLFFFIYLKKCIFLLYVKKLFFFSDQRHMGSVLLLLVEVSHFSSHAIAKHQNSVVTIHTVQNLPRACPNS